MCSLLYINYTSIKRILKCHGFQQRWIGFTLLIQATKKLDKYIKQWLWDTGQDNRQHRRVSFRERKWRQWAQCFGSLYRKIFQASAQRKKTQEKPLVFLRWDSRVWRWRRSRLIDVKGESTGGEGAEVRAVEVCRGFLLRWQLSSALCRHARKGEDLLACIRWTTPRAHPGLRRVHVPTSHHGLTT